jgi:hypothetical protein
MSLDHTLSDRNLFCLLSMATAFFTVNSIWSLQPLGYLFPPLGRYGFGPRLPPMRPS